MSSMTLRQALAAGTLREVDVYFAERISRGAGDDRDAVALAAALVSQALGEGHVCVDLMQCAEQAMFAHESFAGIPAPAYAAWLELLRRSPVVGAAGEMKPLILDGQQLYLGRYWHFEQQLAERLLQFAAHSVSAPDHELLRSGLARLFHPDADSGMDWQQLAACMAVLQPLCVISGGPGTGKTHTVTAILALLVEQARARRQRLRITLAAPTGKAAARLTESVRGARAALQVSDEVKQYMPDEAVTLHRLLGVRPDSVTPRHHEDNPLHLDVLVVDEASMIDLPMMNRLLAALPAQARLIVLGDKDQLASVEAGSMFADLCGNDAEAGYSMEFVQRLQSLAEWPGLIAHAEQPVGLSDNVVLLRKSYRFSRQSGIGQLSRAVNAGDLPGVRDLLQSASADIRWRTVSGEATSAEMMAYAVAAFAPAMQAAGPQQALQELGRFRILCALRRGRQGVEQVNQLVQQALRKHGHIVGTGDLYAGRPIMILRNDYQLGLFNGDIGILWPDQEGVLRACFHSADGTLHTLAPHRLPAHETAFALTVHKAQGSEFSKVLLLLPESDNPVLTRELIYTGITRAADAVEIWGDSAILEQAVQRRVQRSSGLSDRLS